MSLNRRKRTLLFLLIATFISWLIIYLFEEPLDSSSYKFMLMLQVPILFGTALLYSNREYYTSPLSIFLLYFLFLIIFIWATLPFYRLGEYLFDNSFASSCLGCFSAFAFVMLAAKLNIKQMEIGYIQIILLIFFPFISVGLVGFFTNKSFFDVEEISKSGAKLVILSSQIFMSILIASMIKNDTKIHYENSASQSPDHL